MSDERGATKAVRTRRRRRVIIGQRLVQLLPAPFALAGEGAILLLLLDRHISLGAWMLAHAGVALAMMLWAKWIGRRVRRNQIAWFLAVVTAGLGPVGPFAAMVAGALLVHFHRDRFNFQEWYSSLFPTDVKSRVVQLYELLLRRRSVGGGGVESFADVLSGQDAVKKRLAIALLTRHFRPGFAPALRLALLDSDASVRTQAATAVATIEGRFVASAQGLTRKLGTRPRSFRRRLALARHYDDYAFTGLLDPERERDNRLKALEAYQSALQVRPRDQRCWLAIGRLLVRERRYEAANQWFETATARNLIDADMLVWQVEALFKLGRYERLRQILAANRHLFPPDGKHPPQVSDMLRLWAPAPDEAAS